MKEEKKRGKKMEQGIQKLEMMKNGKNVRGLFRDKKWANAAKECDFTVNSPLFAAISPLTVVEPTARASEARFPSHTEGGSCIA